MSEFRLAAVSGLAPALWGTTYIVTTELLPEARPLLAGAFRALPAALLLLVGLAVLTGRLALPRGAWWWRAPLLGSLNIGLFFALLFIGAYRLPGGVAAVIGAVGPFVVAVLALLVLREPPGARALVGAAIVVLGVALLVLRSAITLDSVGIAAAFFATVSVAMGTVLGRRWGVPGGYRRRATALLALTGWQLAAGGLLLLPVALLVEGAPPALTGLNLAGFGYLAVAGTALAYYLWFRGVTGGLGPTRMTVLAQLTPVVAAALGWVILAEALGPAQITGAVAVLCGVVLGASGSSRPGGPRGDPPPARVATRGPFGYGWWRRRPLTGTGGSGAGDRPSHARPDSASTRAGP